MQDKECVLPGAHPCRYVSESKDLLAHSHSQNVEPLTQGVVTRCACCPRLGDSNTGTKYWTGQVMWRESAPGKNTDNSASTGISCCKKPPSS